MKILRKLTRLPQGINTIKLDYTFAELLNLKHSVLIGSRAFDVHTSKSDYDLVVLESELPKELLMYATDLSKYFTVIPLNNPSLIRKAKTLDGKLIDIIIYEEIKDINTTKLALKDCLKIPMYMIQDKQFRIQTFEKALIEYGFKTVNRLTL